MVAALARFWARLRGRRYGDYIWTASGRRFWPLDPRPEDIFIEDIARGLATGCRYSGQIGFGTGFDYYSVGEHSVIVSIFAERRARELGLEPLEVWSWALAGLLHDASEAYIGDVSRPLKYSREMRGYCRVEARLERVIAERYYLRWWANMWSEIKTIDNRLLVDEMDAFMMLPEGDTLDAQIAKHGQPLGVNIAGLSPGAAEHVFLQRYAEIMRAFEKQS